MIDRIKRIINSLIEKDKPLNNKEIYSIINKFSNVNENKITDEDIVQEYNRLLKIQQVEKQKIEEYNATHNYNNVFANIGIYTINDLYKYMNNNFEYGTVITIEDKKIKLPFGPVNGVAKNNIITQYQDENVLNFVLDFYNTLDENNKITDYIKEQYYNNDSDICLLKEYQEIIYKVSSYIQKNIWHQRNTLEILNDQISNCYESSFLVSEFFKLNKIKYQKYIIGRYDNIALAHMFITYSIDDKYYYFEHALRDFKGIYEYNSKEEMEQDIFTKFIYNDNYKMEKELKYDNYFLKPIDDLDPNDSFDNYFKYFSTINTIKLKNKNYETFMYLTDLVFKELINVGFIYNNDTNIFYTPIILPSKKDFHDIELWKKKVFQILRKNIINISFYKSNKESVLYTLNPLGGFIRYDNIIKVDGVKARAQLLYSKKKVYNIYTVEDVKKELETESIGRIKDILMFTAFLENKRDLYDYSCYFTTTIGKETIKLINNDITNDKLCTTNDIDLSGVIDKKKFSLSNDNFLSQIIAISSSLEIIKNAIKLITQKDYTNDLINSYVDYLVYMIDINSIDIQKIKNEDTGNNSEFIDKLVTKLLNSLFLKNNNKN